MPTPVAGDIAAEPAGFADAHQRVQGLDCALGQILGLPRQTFLAAVPVFLDQHSYHRKHGHKTEQAKNSSHDETQQQQCADLNMFAPTLTRGLCRAAPLKPDLR